MVWQHMLLFNESNTRKGEICVTGTKIRSNTHMTSSPPKRVKMDNGRSKICNPSRFVVYTGYNRNVSNERWKQVVLKYILSLNLAT